ncbi:MAG: hemin uptake protein HemP [Planctomycetota bacterium]|jgi:hemin uptake protein HemP
MGSERQPEEGEAGDRRRSEGASPRAERVEPRLPKIVPFRELCRCGEEIWIENDGELYRLRRTRQGKLILTK